MSLCIVTPSPCIVNSPVVFTIEEFVPLCLIVRSSPVPKTALALSGIGMDETNVELVADPNIENNFHYLRAEGTFGNLEVKVDAVPSLNNPKTSHLAALSIINQLEKLDL